MPDRRLPPRRFRTRPRQDGRALPAILVNNRNRWLVHAGDAYFHHHAVSGAGPVPVGFRVFERATEMNPVQRRASAAALRQLRTSYEDVELFCAHDPTEYARYA